MQDFYTRARWHRRLGKRRNESGLIFLPAFQEVLVTYIIIRTEHEVVYRYRYTMYIGQGRFCTEGSSDKFEDT